MVGQFFGGSLNLHKMAAAAFAAEAILDYPVSRRVMQVACSAGEPASEGHVHGANGPLAMPTPGQEHGWVYSYLWGWWRPPSSDVDVDERIALFDHGSVPIDVESAYDTTVVSETFVDGVSTRTIVNTTHDDVYGAAQVITEITKIVSGELTTTIPDCPTRTEGTTTSRSVNKQITHSNFRRQKYTLELLNVLREQFCCSRPPVATGPVGEANRKAMAACARVYRSRRKQPVSMADHNKSLAMAIVYAFKPTAYMIEAHREQYTYQFRAAHAEMNVVPDPRLGLLGIGSRPSNTVARYLAGVPAGPVSGP